MSALDAYMDADDCDIREMAPNDVCAEDTIGSLPADVIREYLLKLSEADPSLAAGLQRFHEARTESREAEAKAMQYSEQVIASEAGDEQMNRTCAADCSAEDAARFVPLRLTFDERALLRLLESSLHVSEYTDRIDISMYASNRARRMAAQIKQMCAILSGLVVAHNYDLGKVLIKERDFAVNEQFFQMVFEIGRRYKILNPERMRDSYGKLLYLLMDTVRDDVRDLTGLRVVMPVRSVHSILSVKKNGMELLRDPLVETATREIIPDGLSRAEVQRQIRAKNDAVKSLSRKYASVRRKAKGRGFFYGVGYSFGLLRNQYDSESEEEAVGAAGGLTEDDIEQCLYSLGDHNTYLRFNRDPVVRMLEYLKSYFTPTDAGPDAKFSLAISSGVSGARLSHSHQKQYTFVLQTLILWKHVLGNMFQLWHLAEADLLDEQGRYSLRDTGQGLQRVMQAPRTYKRVSSLLSRAQQEAGGWLGSAMIHLGDHNVPNALMFIDKYTQVPRILGPLVTCLDKIPEVAKSSASLRAYIESFGGAEAIRKMVLADFFRHGFDGSGADNFYDAGSCVDGRLTSAWNWCSKIEKKEYFPVLLLTGFTGFDGKEGW